MNKKDITIHKKKKDYKHAYKALDAKELLFEQLTPQEIIDELANNSILLTLQDIKTYYEKSHHLQTMINQFDEQYKNELTTLDNKMELFDSDALYFLCDKYVKEHYYPTQLFDPDYIEDLIDDYIIAPKKNKPQLLLNILHNVNGMAKFHKSKNLEVIFKGTLFDIENYIVDCTVEILNCSLPKEEVILFINEFKQLIKTYDFDIENEFNIYRDLIEILAQYSLSDAQELLDYALKQYPNDKQSIYLSLLYGLEECDEVENMKSYYHKAIQLMPISPLDIDSREILINCFSYLKD